MNMNRRSFLGLGVAAAASTIVPKPSWAADEKSDLETILEGTTLKDQNGEKIDLQKVLGDREAIVLFGYDGCPMCQEITKTVKAVQDALMEKNMDTPIVVISTQPTVDSTEKNREAFTKRYATSGISQFMRTADEKPTPEGAEKELADFKKMPSDEKQAVQRERVFHLVTPASEAEAMEIQKKLQTRNGTPNELHRDNAKQHSRYLTVFSKGDVATTKDGKPAAFRGVELNKGANIELKPFKATPAIIQAAVSGITNTLEALQNTRSRE